MPTLSKLEAARPDQPRLPQTIGLDVLLLLLGSFKFSGLPPAMAVA
jgi:hypothetical protein